MFAPVLGWVSIEQHGGTAAACPGTEPGMFLHTCPDPSLGKCWIRWSGSEGDMLTLSCSRRSLHTWKGQLWRVGVSLTWHPGQAPDDNSAYDVNAPKWQTQEGSSPQRCSQEHFVRSLLQGFTCPALPFLPWRGIVLGLPAAGYLMVGFPET